MTKQIHIGFDLSITEQFGAEADARVYVEAQHGEVRIVGPFVDWAGYKVVPQDDVRQAHDADQHDVCEFDAQDRAELLAWEIAHNPVAEFDRMGYEHAMWFKPANA